MKVRRKICVSIFLSVPICLFFRLHVYLFFLHIVVMPTITIIRGWMKEKHEGRKGYLCFSLCTCIFVRLFISVFLSLIVVMPTVTIIEGWMDEKHEDKKLDISACLSILLVSPSVYLSVLTKNIWVRN